MPDAIERRLPNFSPIPCYASDMGDRQFLRLMAIVVATGLALGLVAFRVRSSDSTAAMGAPGPVATASAAAASPGASTASASSSDIPSDDPFAPTVGADGKATAAPEPLPPSGNPPAMRGAANLDPDGSAVANSPTNAPVDPGAMGGGQTLQ